MYILKKRTLFYTIASIIFLNACTKLKTAPVSNNTAPITFSEVFEQYWNMMNRNYVYWDIDTTKWESIYKKYQPLFAKLNLDNTYDILQSVSYFKDMSTNLIDEHYSIRFLPNVIRDSSFSATSLYKTVPHYPISAYYEYDAKKFPYQSYWDIDTTNYFTRGNYIAGSDASRNIVSNFGRPLEVLLAVIKNKILYFSFNQFSLSQSAYNYNPNNFVTSDVSAPKIIDSFIYLLNNLPSNIQAIFIDVRDNGGGDVTDLNFLVGRFINKPLHIGYTKYKSGNGRLDFTGWIPSYINPLPNAVTNITVPIYVLADAFSISAAELTTMAIHTLPNGHFVGEQTFGATGPFTQDGTIWNDGPFTIEKFMEITTSSGQFKYLDDNVYEGKGFPADYPVNQKNDVFQNDISTGKDRILEKAMSLVP